MSTRGIDKDDIGRVSELELWSIRKHGHKVGAIRAEK